MATESQIRKQFEQNIKSTEAKSFKVPREWYYQGIHNLRKSEIKYPYEQWQIDEILKCKDDPIYFIKTYIKIINLDRGLINFDLYEFQEEMIKRMGENRFNIFKIPRQSGKTTTSCGYYVHQLLFNPVPQAIGIVANKKAMATKITAIVQLMYVNLPFWMQKGVTIWQKTEFELEDHSFVISDATSSSSLRGRSINLLGWDECCRIDTTYITVRNKNTGEIKKLLIKDLVC